MRVLLTTIPGHGHFTPLVPLGRALVDAGHDVAVATAAAFGPVVERAGFEHLAAGIENAEANARALERHPDLVDLPQDQGWRVITDRFIEQDAAAMLEDAELLLSWRPDVLVREEGEFAGPLIAAMANVPWVDHGWGPIRPAELVERAAVALAPVWAAHGIEPDPTGGAYRWLYLDPCPPSLQFAHAADVPVLHRIRPVSRPTSDGAAIPEWLERVIQRRAVYITLGTVPVFANDPDFFMIAIEALSSEDVEIVVTVGPEGDAAMLGHQPPHVHVERYISQGLVLPHCDLAITNAGSGSTIGALAAGVPVLAVSDFRSPSQVRNGQAIAERGAGRTIARDQVTVGRLRDAIKVLLHDDSYRAVARRIGDEIAVMPSPRETTKLLEHLVQQ